MDQPPICDIIRIPGMRTQVIFFIQFELIKMNDLISVGGKLTDSQVQFIATQFIEFFPNESLADFKLCFQRGCMGQYNRNKKDDIFRMDGIVLRQWMEQYLDEKYQAVENKLMNERETFVQPIAPPENKDWYKIWQESIDALPKTRRFDLTQEEIKREGQIEPVTKPYNPSVVDQLKHANDSKNTIRECRRKYFLDAFPDATQEEIKEYWEKFDDTKE